MNKHRIYFILGAIVVSSLLAGWLFSRPSLKDYNFLAVTVGGTEQTPPLSAMGTIRIPEYQGVYAQTSGIVTKILVAPGQSVKQDQPLVELDYRSSELELYRKLDQIAGRLDINRVVGGYLGKMEKKTDGGESSFRSSGLEDHLLKTVRDYVGLLKVMEDMRERTKDKILVAPIGGTVSELNVSLGDRIDANRQRYPVVGVIGPQKAPIQISLELSEEVASFVNPGDQVSAYVPLLQAADLRATLRSVATSLTTTETARYFLGTAQVSEGVDLTKLRQGMKVMANITTRQRPMGIWIPRSAIDLEVPESLVSETLFYTSSTDLEKSMTQQSELELTRTLSSQGTLSIELETSTVVTDVRNANVYLLTADGHIVKAVVPIGPIGDSQVLAMTRAIEGTKIITHFQKKRRSVSQELKEG